MQTAIQTPVNKQIVLQKKQEAAKVVDINKPKYKVQPSFKPDYNVFKKTADERLQLKAMKAQWKSGNRRLTD